MERRLHSSIATVRPQHSRRSDSDCLSARSAHRQERAQAEGRQRARASPEGQDAASPDHLSEPASARLQALHGELI